MVNETRLQLAEKIGNFGLGPVDGADELAAHYAVAVDNVGFGELERAIQVAALLAGVANRQQIHVVVFEEAVVGRLIDIDADSDYGYTFGLHAALHLDQGWHFFHAGRTPGRPEIQHNNLAAIIAELYGAVGILHGDFWGCRSDAGRARAAVTRREQDQAS